MTTDPLPREIPLLPLGPRQAAPAARTLALAFADDPLVTRICPDPATRLTLIEPVFHYTARLAAANGQAWAVGATPDGVSLWLPSWRMGCAPWRWFLYGGHRVGRGMEPRHYRLLNEVSSVIDRERDRVAPRRYLYLSNLGVLPAARRQGLATALVLPPVQEAARQGLPTLVETNTPASLAFYRAVGFRVINDFQAYGMEYYVLRA